MAEIAPQLSQTVHVPEGFRLTGVHCGIKSDPQKEDLTIIFSEREAVAAGVYTQNLVRAAPVELDRTRTPSRNIRAVVVNSGNANACTGNQGRKDAGQICHLVAEQFEIEAEQVLVMSTGIIGKFLPMAAIRCGITAAADRLGDDEGSIIAAARGMMTTDTVPKIAGRRITVAAENDCPDGCTIMGLAKGAAMIGPRMATMLGVLITDAVIAEEVAQPMLAEVVEKTFNCIHVDGHMSTNDTVLLLAGGASGTNLSGSDQQSAFRDGLYEVCAELARSIPADGEGTTHLITIDVRGCCSEQAAQTIARSVADSPLVKTAIAGADPNWGRIVSAAGYAGIPFNPEALQLRLNGQLLFCESSPVDFPAADVSRSIRENRDVSIELLFSEGDAAARFWTTDLTSEYVRLNTDYHT
jgi:glutamate N-acetyltransferase/amino-acid N-acetyltransferase